MREFVNPEWDESDERRGLKEGEEPASRKKEEKKGETNKSREPIWVDSYHSWR